VSDVDFEDDPDLAVCNEIAGTPSDMASDSDWSSSSDKFLRPDHSLDSGEDRPADDALARDLELPQDHPRVGPDPSTAVIRAS
jgi:hypothetical protein